VRKLWVLGAVVALLVPGAARAKLTGDLRMCGLSGCRMIERHLSHDGWPLLGAVSTWPSNAGPAPPGPFYRLTIVPLDERGRPDLARESQPVYLVPTARRSRNEDGWGGVYWSRFEALPPKLAAAARVLRPFPAPRLTRVVVGNRAAADPHSYLRLFRLPVRRERVRDPAGPRPGVEPTTREIVSYWERVRRLFLPILVESRRITPWSDPMTSLWIGRRHDMLLRDGELVRVPHALAERVRRAQSLR
jgi:hypothetical protein